MMTSNIISKFTIKNLMKHNGAHRHRLRMSDTLLLKFGSMQVHSV